MLKEAGLGDAEMSRRRLEALSGLTVLAVDKSARSLAGELLAARILPPAAASDAIHAVVAAQQEIKFCSRGIAGIWRTRICLGNSANSWGITG